MKTTITNVNNQMKIKYLGISIFLADYHKTSAGAMEIDRFQPPSSGKCGCGFPYTFPAGANICSVSTKEILITRVRDFSHASCRRYALNYVLKITEICN